MINCEFISRNNIHMYYFSYIFVNRLISHFFSFFFSFFFLSFFLKVQNRLNALFVIRDFELPVIEKCIY